MPNDGTQIQSVDTTTTQPSVTTSQQAGGGAAGAQTGGTESWAQDDKFRGKSADDLYRSYKELEKKLGGWKQTEDELSQWRHFGSQWDPVLRQFGYRPETLVQALEQRAAAQRAAGDHAGARQTDAQAQRAWADAVTPQEQEQWLRQTMAGHVTPLQQHYNQGLQQLAQQGQSYINNVADLLLRAVEMKFKHPNLTLGELLQEAARFVSPQFDPLEMAGRLKSQPSEADLRARIEKEVTEKLKAEQANSQLTTMVGAGSARGGRSLKPTSSAPAAPETAARRPMKPTLDGARDAFAKRWSQMVNSGEGS